MATNESCGRCLGEGYVVVSRVNQRPTLEQCPDCNPNGHDCPRCGRWVYGDGDASETCRPDYICFDIKSDDEDLSHEAWLAKQRICTNCTRTGEERECPDCQDAEGGCPTTTLSELIAADTHLDVMVEYMQELHQKLLKGETYDNLIDITNAALEGYGYGKPE